MSFWDWVKRIFYPNGSMGISKPNMGKEDNNKQKEKTSKNKKKKGGK